MFVFVTRQRAEFGETLVALVARVEAFAVVANCHGWGWSQTLGPAADAATATEFGFFATTGRDASRGGCVPTVVSTRVAGLASFVTRTNRSQRGSFNCLFLGARNIGRLWRQFSIKTTLTSVE